MIMSNHNRSTKEIEEALASLQLPQMPQEQEQQPTITILVVADIDLRSASALSEYTLENHLNADLCIACGSFCRDEDLHPYYNVRGGGGGEQQQRRDRGGGAGARVVASIESGWSSTPFFRTREQTAALEGLMTATLSQLENIVCRVVYCPGSTDPLTCFINNNDHHHPRRLTPNSRNLHQQWLPLAPGLGAAALLYLDFSEKIIRDTGEGLKRWASPYSGISHDDTGEDYEADEEIALWIEQLQQLQQNCKGYCSTLERLLKLAPPVQHAVPFAQQSQTILVTHYLDCTTLFSSTSNSSSTTNDDDDRDTDNDYMPINGSPLWAMDKEDKPWPVEHSIFHASAIARQHLCLEIASGSPSQHKPQVVTKGNNTILLPGSLRERGEFSVVHVSLQETTELLSGSSTNDLEEDGVPIFRRNHKRQRAFSWVVKKVDFHKLSELLA